MTIEVTTILKTADLPPVLTINLKEIQDQDLLLLRTKEEEIEERREKDLAIISIDHQVQIVILDPNLIRKEEEEDQDRLLNPEKDLQDGMRTEIL